MDAVRIPVRQRILLFNPRGKSIPLHVLKLYLLNRWAGQLPEDGVLTETGLACGACGHHSFWKRTMLRHSHPDDRPVPLDMIAALNGEGPVPEWFLRRRGPDGEG